MLANDRRYPGPRQARANKVRPGYKGRAGRQGQQTHSGRCGQHLSGPHTRSVQQWSLPSALRNPGTLSAAEPFVNSRTTLLRAVLLCLALQFLHDLIQNGLGPFVWSCSVTKID